MGAENCADGCGRRGCNGVAGKLEMGREKKPLVMSELGCADGCGRANGCGEVHGRLRTAWVQLSGWKLGGEKKPLVMSELGCADGCGRAMGAEKCTDGCGRRGCKGVAGNGWGEEAADDERAWLRGRLRTANGLGELRGRLRTAWVPRLWLEMGGEKKQAGDQRAWPNADGCGREMGAENCADGCRRRGCNGVAGNVAGEKLSRW